MIDVAKPASDSARPSSSDAGATEPAFRRTATACKSGAEPFTQVKSIDDVVRPLTFSSSAGPGGKLSVRGFQVYCSRKVNLLLRTFTRTGRSGTEDVPPSTTIGAAQTRYLPGLRLRSLPAAGSFLR